MIIIYRILTAVTLLMGLSFGQAQTANPYAGKTCVGTWESPSKQYKGAYVLDFNAAGTSAAMSGNRGTWGDYAYRELQTKPNISREEFHIERWDTDAVQQVDGQFGQLAYNFILEGPKRSIKLYLPGLSPQGAVTGKEDVSGKYYGVTAFDIRLNCHDRPK